MSYRDETYIMGNTNNIITNYFLVAKIGKKLQTFIYKVNKYQGYNVHD